ncbi:MAG: hypothetical protein M1834_009264 [Cirrosporium novae-zelandiae]|nr:MAG: hypothetical protein M1834_009264 [Cirrosporium novae-zelandiae]
MSDLDQFDSDTDSISSFGSDSEDIETYEKIMGPNGKPVDQGTLASLADDIFNDCLYNIIHDIVTDVHREEKTLRMESAVVMAEKAAEDATKAEQLQESPKGKDSKPEPLSVKVDTEGAVYDHGQVRLKGNPLMTTKDIFCIDCKKPRLLHPTIGIGSEIPPNTISSYCNTHPIVSQPGLDVHGHLFASDKLNNKKRKVGHEAETPQSSSTVSSPPNSQSNNLNSLSALAPVTYPMVRCPHICGRYFEVRRLAQHLDKCWGAGGRNASRNAMNKMSNTPGQGSRAGTPKPSQTTTGKRAREDGNSGPAKTKKAKLANGYSEEGTPRSSSHKNHKLKPPTNIDEDRIRHENGVKDDDKSGEDSIKVQHKRVQEISNTNGRSSKSPSPHNGTSKKASSQIARKKPSTNSKGSTGKKPPTVKIPNRDSAT